MIRYENVSAQTLFHYFVGGTVELESRVEGDRA